MSARSPNSKKSDKRTATTIRQSVRLSSVARLWHGATPAANAEAYAGYLLKTGVKDCRATPGNRGVQVLRRTTGDVAHFLFISFWDSMDSIRRFAGADIEKARYHPEDRDYLLELAPTVSHYEVIVS